MRKHAKSDGLSVQAVAGTHVVMLGFDLTPARRRGCLGFAIQREDSLDGERVWLRGMKCFEATDPGLGLGGTAPSNQHPFQTFQWADYAAKPGVTYTYHVTAMYGTPSQLREGPSVSVKLATEAEAGTARSAAHSVYFNRGSAASQEYARRFGVRRPSEVGPAAYAWLSRGLLEAFVAFVARANGRGFSLHAALYECQWPQALEALKGAKRAGATVELLYDAIAAKGPGTKNTAALATAGLTSIAAARSVGTIMHNKFVVLSRNGRPVAVWTGSTNLTENGIFGHSNVGHVVEDAGVAAQYLAYWQQIRQDEALANDRDWASTNNPDPAVGAMPPNGTSAFVSPRKGEALLAWYAGLAGRRDARGDCLPLFMTFAFGMHKSFLDVYRQQDGVLRMALMEKEGNGTGLAQGREDIARVRRLPNVVVSLGRSIVMNSFDRWLKELDAATKTAHVKYVHDKFMLSDPLGPDPLVVTGSANFSKASTVSNHENMLVIRGDTRVADIYLGEYMRLFSHYAFREAVAIARERGESDWAPQHLIANDAWSTKAYASGSQQFLRRTYFAKAAT